MGGRLLQRSAQRRLVLCGGGDLAMMQYPSFVYLQNHKTGCSFVEAYLRRFCAEPLLDYKKHAALRELPKVFCFANVREPLDLYRSLYAYGLDGRGRVFQSLKLAGMQNLYAEGAAGFADWLAFVLEPWNAPFLDPAYTPDMARFMGLATWRFLRLACPGFQALAPTLSGLDALQSRVAPLYALGAVLKQEQLREGLATLTRTRLAHCIPDQEGAIEWLAQADRVNTSMAVVDGGEVPLSLRALVFAKDALIYRNFYPSIEGHGLPQEAGVSS